MKTTRILIAVSVLCLICLTSSAQRSSVQSQTGPVAAMSGFIKFDGIDGESTHKEHSKWCDLLSINQTYTRSASSDATRKSGSLTMADFNLAKHIDKSTPKLMEAISKGKIFPIVEIELTNAAGTYLRYELKNVIITSYSISSESGQPMEQLSLNYEEIKVVYTEMQAGKATGNKVEFTWNLKENVK